MLKTPLPIISVGRVERIIKIEKAVVNIHAGTKNKNLILL